MTMAIPAKHRWILYAVALALTLVAVRWAGGQDRAEQRAAAQAPAPDRAGVREASAEAARAEAPPEVRLDLLAKRTAPAPAGDPFRTQSWEPPPEQRVRRSPPPPPPQAPVLPFAYMGKLVEDTTTTVFLARQDRNYIVRAGDTIDGTYRVEKVGDDAVEFVYLPLKAKQTLPFTATAPAPAAARTDPGARARRPDPDDDEDED
jgi:hypothetical protein